MILIFLIPLDIKLNSNPTGAQDLNPIKPNPKPNKPNFEPNFVYSNSNPDLIRIEKPKNKI